MDNIAAINLVLSSYLVITLASALVVTVYALRHDDTADVPPLLLYSIFWLEGLLWLLLFGAGRRLYQVIKIWLP